jgi:hypothetical protein
MAEKREGQVVSARIPPQVVVAARRIARAQGLTLSAWLGWIVSREVTAKTTRDKR